MARFVCSNEVPFSNRTRNMVKSIHQQGDQDQALDRRGGRQEWEGRHARGESDLRLGELERARPARALGARRRRKGREKGKRTSARMKRRRLMKILRRVMNGVVFFTENGPVQSDFSTASAPPQGLIGASRP